MSPRTESLDRNRSAVAGAATIASAEAAHPDSRAYRTALGSQCCGCRRPHPVGRRTTRQNDDAAITRAAQNGTWGAHGMSGHRSCRT